jgi:glucose/mannose-6-phosphate isomerase
MFSVIRDFPMQMEDALFIANNFPPDDFNSDGISNIVVCGMGGSAVGGDLVRNLISNELSVPMVISRGYSIPGFADESTLVIISSYSGNTEETLSSYNEAVEKGCRIICVTTGGTAEEIARENGYPVLIIPKGFQPRAALAYSFIPILMILTKLNFTEDRTRDLKDTIKLLREKSSMYSNFNDIENLAIRVAETIKGKIPVIYSSNDLETVNMRWRTQLEENAKITAYGNFYPEMTHNEIVGWSKINTLSGRFFVIMMKDSDDNSRVRARMDISEEMLKGYANGLVSLESDAETKLQRIFELVYLGDWVSYYLAIMNETDPTPIESISYLKSKLAER